MATRTAQPYRIERLRKTEPWESDLIAECPDLDFARNVFALAVEHFDEALILTWGARVIGQHPPGCFTAAEALRTGKRAGAPTDPLAERGGTDG